MEVTWGAVNGAVHIHRRDDDAVAQRQFPQRQRHEHRRARGTAARSGEVGVDLVDEPRIAQAQVVVGHAPAAGQQVESKLGALLMDVAAEPLEPLE